LPFRSNLSDNYSMRGHFVTPKSRSVEKGLAE
jgi:hypothetical protein